MTPDTIDLDFLPLKVTHLSPKGKRSFDPDGKLRLVEACLRPGASLAGLALKARVNANQLRKWVRCTGGRAQLLGCRGRSNLNLRRLFPW